MKASLAVAHTFSVEFLTYVHNHGFCSKDLPGLDGAQGVVTKIGLPLFFLALRLETQHVDPDEQAPAVGAAMYESSVCNTCSNREPLHRHCGTVLSLRPCRISEAK